MVESSVGCETNGRRETRQIAILTDNFFSWPYYVVLFSRSHKALLLLGRGYSTGALSLTVSWLYPRTSLLPTPAGISYIISQRLQLLIRSCDLLPLIYTGASLTDGRVKGQCATFFSKCPHTVSSFNKSASIRLGILFPQILFYAWY